MPTKCIVKKAVEFSVENEMIQDGSIKILSIGRFCKAKNFDNVPDICKKILDAGFDIKWYLIGFGGDEELIRQKISEYQMEENVIILGKKVNPYPYIKACDLYIQPSRYEGNSVSVHEAQFLQKPVVITQYATAESQLINQIDGIIVPMDNVGCAEGIVSLLRNSKTLEILKNNCTMHDYAGSAMWEKIEKLINE